jgi:molecular chaperone DnaK
MARIIGIDLGTTNSCVAALDERGNPMVLANDDGSRTIPSCVSWLPNGQIVVGTPALRQAVTNPTSTIFGVKRLIGRKVNSDDVAWFSKLAPFRIVAAVNGDAWVRVDNIAGAIPVSPQEVAAHVLRKVRAAAEHALGEPVTRAVVTVPAYFDEMQRQATRDAGTIAGLEIVRILNEPTAAALAYGAHRVGKNRRLIAVFDLGGGTFDISVMAVENGIFEVLATGGDSALGGEDWDRRMLESVMDEIFDQHRVDLTSNSVALSRLREALESAKRQLSTSLEAVIHLPMLCNDSNGAPLHYSRTLTRAALESSTKDLIDRLRAPCERALIDAGLEAKEVEEVLLVGGMTRWPAVQTLVEKVFGRKPSKGANPDEVVALGAASYAGILAGESDDATLLDVTPHDIGIKIGEDQFAVIIPRNSMLPVRARKVFATTTPDQKFVAIELYQGISTSIAENRRLGRVVLGDLPPGPAGSVRVELILTIDVESILEVTAREPKSGQQTSVTVRPTGGLSKEDIFEIVSRRREESSFVGKLPAGVASTVGRVSGEHLLPSEPSKGDREE